MTSTQPTEPTPRRSPLPSVRVLLALTLLLAVGTVFLTVVLPYQRQMKLVEYIANVGGLADLKPVGPDWLRNVVGDHRMKGFDEVIYVDLAQTPTTDEILTTISECSHLKTLFLDDTQITDAGLESLNGLVALEQLSLDGTQITDEGLRSLSSLRTLRMVGLSGTRITDAGIKCLAKLRCLELLYLNDTQITDHGVVCLAGLFQLNSLMLNGTKVTDECLKHLSRLSHLEDLWIDDTLITAGGIKLLQSQLPDCFIYYSPEDGTPHPPFQP